jgi:thioredoxin:protein disulfide reductase
MDLPRTSTGSPPKRSPTGVADRLHLACGALAVAAALLSPAATAQAKLLEPERAFAFSARALDERTVEARFAIAGGYYLYRDKLKFAVEPGALAAAPILPAGKIKHDEFFGEVETYRGAIVVRLPLDRAAPGQPVTLRAESQGCADVGVCYPPQAQKITLSLPAAGGPPGAVVDAVPPRKSWFN